MPPAPVEDYDPFAEEAEMVWAAEEVRAEAHAPVPEAIPMEEGREERAEAEAEEAPKPMSIWDHPLTFRNLQKYINRIDGNAVDAQIVVYDMKTGTHCRLYAVDSPRDVIDPNQEFYTFYAEPIEVGPVSG